jgi:hypothetical protein
MCREFSPRAGYLSVTDRSGCYRYSADMRPPRGPYARRDAETSWFLFSSYLLLALLVLCVPAYIFWPDLFPGVMMWLLGAVALNMGLWTISAGSRDVLQPHQVVANLVMMVILVLFIVGLAVDAPGWVTVALVSASGITAVVALYQRRD